MFGIQGLWSAARYEVPVVIVVLNNAEYRACKQGFRSVVGDAAGRYVGMDLAPPVIDFPALAESLGVRGRRAEGTDAIAGEIEDALASGAPTLIDVPVTGFEQAQPSKEEVRSAPTVP